MLFERHVVEGTDVPDPSRALLAGVGSSSESSRSSTRSSSTCARPSPERRESTTCGSSGATRRGVANVSRTCCRSLISPSESRLCSRSSAAAARTVGRSASPGRLPTSRAVRATRTRCAIGLHPRAPPQPRSSSCGCRRRPAASNNAATPASVANGPRSPLVQGIEQLRWQVGNEDRVERFPPFVPYAEGRVRFVRPAREPPPAAERGLGSGRKNSTSDDAIRSYEASRRSSGLLASMTWRSTWSTTAWFRPGAAGPPSGAQGRRR